MDLTHSRPPSASCCPLPSSQSPAAASFRNSSAMWRQLQLPPSSSSFSSSHRLQRNLVYRASAAAAPTLATPTASLYAVLGVEKDVSMSSIKSAYRRLALRYHPDVAAGPSSPGSDVEASTLKFLEVQEAYEILSDPARRADYDFSLMHPFCAQALSSNFHMRPPRRRRCSTGHSDSSVSSAWKLQWEAQISRLKQRRQAAQHPASASAASSPPPPPPPSPPPSTSWAARVRWHNLSQDNSCPVCV